MQQIGRYRILGELGRGAMGVVYGALDPAIGRHVAIKTIRLVEVGDLQERKRLHERLLREAQSAGVLSHPGIVVVYDVGQQDDLTYIAMEFVNGPSLEKLLHAETPPRPETVVDLLHQTAAALDYAHTRGIVHRDVKPANIMVHEDGKVKITDFGVAKLSKSHNITQAGTVLGTPNYMSPEQVQGKPVDGRADQWSLGVIAYEMLTGEKPFAAEEITTVLYKIVSEEIVPPQNLNASLGWAAGVVIAKALSKDPAARYGSCAEFVRALEAALRTKPGWKPLPHGAAQHMPTAVAAPPVVRQAPPAPAPAAPAGWKRPAPASAAPREGKRNLLWGTLLAAMAAFAVVGLVFVGADQWLTSRNEPVAPAAPREEAPLAARGARPAPMPPPLPAEVESTSDATHPAEPGVEGEAPAEEPDAAQSGAAAEQPAETAAAAQPPSPPPAAEQRRPAPKQEPSAYPIQVTTNPPGATIVFDDQPQQKCTSPCSVPLANGRHTLAATLAGHDRELRIFEVAGQPRELFVNLRKVVGSVRVESDPPGAQILINNRPRPEKTPATLVLPAGNYTVAVIRNGKKVEQEFRLREGAAVRVDFSLH